MTHQHEPSAAATKICKELKRASLRLEPQTSRLRPGDLSLIDRITAYLSEDRIPAADNLITSQQDAIDLALSSIHFLGSIMGHGPENEQICVKARALWPKFWKWADYLLRARVDIAIGEDLSVSVLQTLQVIGRVMAYGVTDEDMLSMMANTPGVLYAVSFYWMQQQNYEELRDLELFGYTISMLLQKDVDWAEAFRAAGGARKFSTAAVHGMRDKMKSRPVRLVSAGEDFLVVQGLVASKLPSAIVYLERAGVIPCLIQLLNVVSGQPTQSESSRKQMLACMTVLQDICIAGGPDSVKRTISSGLVPAVFMSARNFAQAEGADSGIQILRDLLDETIAPYLTWRSVVRAAGKHVATFLNSHNIRVPPALDRGWRPLQDLVHAREGVKTSVDARYLRSCWHCKVPVPDQMSMLRQCAGCRGPRYCSRYCQRQGWPGHREECKSHRRNFFDEEKSSLTITYVERLFARELALVEISSRVDEYNAIVDENLAGVPSNQLLFHVEFNQRPTRVGVSLIKASEKLEELERTPFKGVKHIWAGIYLVQEAKKSITVTEKLPVPNGLKTVG